MEKEFVVSQRERDFLLMAHGKWQNLGSPYSRPNFETWVRSVTKTSIYVRPITAEEFLQVTGNEPSDDDIDRCNCDEIGEVGHQSCGWNEEEQLPNWMCRQ